MVNYDNFGPEKVIDVYHPKTGMRGFLVIDKIALLRYNTLEKRILLNALLDLESDVIRPMHMLV